MIPRWFWMVATVGALLVPGCKNEKAERPTAILDSLPTFDMPLTLVNDTLDVKKRTLVPTSSTNVLDSARHTLVDTTFKADTTFFKRVQLDSIHLLKVVAKVDSSWFRVLVHEENKRKFAVGPMNYPPSEICKPAGANWTSFPANTIDLMTKLTTTKACGGYAQPQFPRRVMQSIQKQGAMRALEYFRDSLPNFCSFVKDSTILAWWIGDDIQSPEYGSAPMITKLARWDSAGMYGKQKCPGMTIWLRALPNQMKGWTWKYVDAAAAQYVGPRRHNDAKTYFTTAIRDAKALNMNLMLGLNILSGGCGPASTGDCPPGITGTSFVRGTRNGQTLYEMSAQEFTTYGNAMRLADSLEGFYSCGYEYWAWGAAWDSKWHERPDDIAASKVLGDKAMSKPYKSCLKR